MKEIFKKSLSILNYQDKTRYILLVFLSILLMFFESFGVAIIIPYLNIIVDGNLKIKVLTDFTSRFSKDELIIYATGVFNIIFYYKKYLYFIFNYIQHKYRVNLNKRLASDLLIIICICHIKCTLKKIHLS